MVEEMKQDQESSRYDNLHADAGTLSKLLDVSEMLAIIENSLLGYKYDPSRSAWVEYSQPLMEREGVYRLVQMLSFSIGVPQQLTKLNDKEVERLVASLRRVGNDFILWHSDEHELHESYFGFVDNLLNYNLRTFLSKTRDGFMVRGLISKIFGIKENVSREGMALGYEEKAKSSLPWGRK